MPETIYRDRVTYRTGPPVSDGGPEFYRVNPAAVEPADFWQVTPVGEPTSDFWQVTPP